MDLFKLTYTLLGGLGLFFFGMKQLSESLQAASGPLIKRSIHVLTTNRIMAVLVGVFITCIVQSSSITTVMVVGMVNAGLMNLAQSIGVIFGANIGTTITGWILAIKIGKYGLAFIGLGIFPMLFIQDRRWQSVGKLLFALGLVFYGLQLMGTAFKPLRSDPTFISLMHTFDGGTLWSLLGCVLITTVGTAVIQSSSAMLGITIALALTGAITYQIAGGMVLGMNIGTTVTAYLASIGTNTIAKRAARAHIFFNILGSVIMIAFFTPFAALIDTLIPGDPDLMLADGSKPNIAAHIAAFHTIFNISVTLPFILVLTPFARFIAWITPEPSHKEHPHLSLLGSIENISPDLAIENAVQEVHKMAGIVRNMLEHTQSYVMGKSELSESENYVNRHEKMTDHMQMEITEYLSKVMQASLSEDQTQLVHMLIRTSDELESVADYCESIVRYRKRLFDANDHFSDAITGPLNELCRGSVKFYNHAINLLENPEPHDRESIYKEFDDLNALAEKVRTLYLEHVQKGEFSPTSALTFSDIVVGLRRIKNHSLNIAEKISGGKRVF